MTSNFEELCVRTVCDVIGQFVGQPCSRLEANNLKATNWMGVEKPVYIKLSNAWFYYFENSDCGVLFP